MKCLVMVRTSTARQSIESQHDEMIDFLKNEGYDKKNLIFIEEQGASAYKVDDAYLRMIQKVKDKILSDSSIGCFACWHLNRAFRNKKVFVDLEDFLIEHKVQFLIKNPYLKLLRDDGSVDKGVELAADLLATLAKQDNEERIAKFARGKLRNSEQGKYNGGPIKYGYRVDEDGYFVEDEVDAGFVRQMYSLYLTKKYSDRQLYIELKSRGYNRTASLISKVLTDKYYYGECDYRNVKPLITKEEFDKVQVLRNEANRILSKSQTLYSFATKLLKCPVCGNSMCSSSTHYYCPSHTKYSASYCTFSGHINQSLLDGLIWYVASEKHAQYLEEKSEKDIEEIKKQIAINEDKIAQNQKNINGLKLKKDRVVSAYIDGLIEADSRDAKIAEINKEQKQYEDIILRAKEAIEYLRMAMSSNKKGPFKLVGATLWMVRYNTLSLKEKKDIAHSYISEILLEDQPFKDFIKDKKFVFSRTKGQHAIHMYICTFIFKDSTSKRFAFCSEKLNGSYYQEYVHGRWRPVTEARPTVRQEYNTKKW